MASHAYWSGQIRVSLVSLAVNVFTATRRSSSIPLHEIDRETGSRIRHQNVTEEGKQVSYENIIKGYEYEKGEYVLLEPEEIDGIKLPSSDELELTQFVDVDAVPLFRFERPYFVAPDGKKNMEIYAVLNGALRETGKIGIGQIALRGREELCAVLATPHGMMLETLRYDRELQEVPETLPETKPKKDYIDLARQLIEQNSSPPDFSQYHDHYHEALMELIEAKKNHRRPKMPVREARPEKVVDFAEALRRSLKGGNKGHDEHRGHGGHVAHRKRA